MNKKLTLIENISEEQQEYIRLNTGEEPFEKIPHGRYINFLADYLENEPNAKRKDAIAAWKKLKNLDVPKTYKNWKKIKT